jgi:hypothetical protein
MAKKVVKKSVVRKKTKPVDPDQPGGDTVETDEDETVEVEEEIDDADRTVHSFEGEALPVKVGDIFEAASNPGSGVVVTPTILEDLVRKGKALPEETEDDSK